MEHKGGLSNLMQLDLINKNNEDIVFSFALIPALKSSNNNADEPGFLFLLFKPNWKTGL